MATAAQVRELLESGYSYESAAHTLGIPAGQAFMIATGLPADGSGAPTPTDLRDKPVRSGSSQHLVNPPGVNPTENPRVMDWVRERAARELKQGA